MVYDHVLTFDKEVLSSMGCCLKRQLINGNRSTGSGRQCQMGVVMQLITKQLGPTCSDSDGASQSVYSCSSAMSCLHRLCMLQVHQSMLFIYHIALVNWQAYGCRYEFHK